MCQNNNNNIYTFVIIIINKLFFMYRQILIPSEQNAILTLPPEWLGKEVMVVAYPITTPQSTEEKQFAWLSGNSRIDNPVHIGKNFRKISREELYDR